MPRVTIRRSPDDPALGGYAHVIDVTLIDELGIDPVVVDGDPGELAVLVGAEEVYRLAGDAPPDPERVVAAVRGRVEPPALAPVYCRWCHAAVPGFLYRPPAVGPVCEACVAWDRADLRLPPPAPG